MRTTASFFLKNSFSFRERKSLLCNLFFIALKFMSFSTLKHINFHIRAILPPGKSRSIAKIFLYQMRYIKMIGANIKLNHHRDLRTNAITTGHKMNWNNKTWSLKFHFDWSCTFINFHSLPLRNQRIQPLSASI
jgi:hypothetical protein